VEEAFDEAGEDGGDHAEGEHVEGDGEEDEGGGGAAALWRVGSEGFFETYEFGFGKERIGRGDRLGRVWRRIWHLGWWRRTIER
jgi:hypothetical protein